MILMTLHKLYTKSREDGWDWPRLECNVQAKKIYESVFFGVATRAAWPW